MVLDGRRGPDYDLTTGFVFSPDGQHLAYVARENDKWFVVVDGQREPDYDAISRGNPIFSSDGTRIAYAAYTQNKWLVIVDGRPERLYIDN
jgi:hypothetical protein